MILKHIWKIKVKNLNYTNNIMENNENSTNCKFSLGEETAIINFPDENKLLLNQNLYENV